MSPDGLSKTESKQLKGLRRRANREEEGMFLAEGLRVVEELLRSRIVLRTALVSPTLEDTPRGRAIANELDARARAFRVSDSELREFADTETPQGVVVCAVTPRASLPEDAPRTMVVLDGIQDPGNFGTLVRSAVAFGAELIVTLPGTVDPWNGKSIRAAAGTSFQAPIVACDVKTLRAWCDVRGVELWGADAAGDSIRSIERPARVALVLGNEGAGLRGETRSALHRLVALPMHGRAESLNAGVAGGILLYLLSENADG